jgi:hypothetical protein
MNEISMNETGQKLILAVGLIGMIGMFGYVAITREGGRHIASTTPESYCAEKGADGWAIRELRCLRRLNAGVCYDPEECKLFAGHRYLPNLDSSLDIRCAGDTGGSHVGDFGTTDCKYIGN